jgi:Na+-translocating ferredoxin:NAD+ oxidoreductase subunit B
MNSSPLFESGSPYRRLARSLDALPNRFPPATDGSELRLLAKIFTPDEASLAANLQPELESIAAMGERLGREPRELAGQLKEMAKKGLIAVGKTAQGQLGFGLMPFVVGIYEAQIGRIDAEMARLFEDYFQNTFKKALLIQPQVHRVIPVGETVKNTMEVQPYESVTGLVNGSQSWGVLDCICRTQKALIGEACGHPIDVCMILSQRPGAFAGGGAIRPLTREEALQTLKRAADAGLVHTVSNNQSETWYICNCCTCGCTILRGMAELGVANVVARSAFVNRVESELCIACGDCISACMFGALKLDLVAEVQESRCVGCGVCVPVCPQNALGLERRLEEARPPLTENDWRAVRSTQNESVVLDKLRSNLSKTTDH